MPDLLTAIPIAIAITLLVIGLGNVIGGYYVRRIWERNRKH